MGLLRLLLALCVLIGHTRPILSIQTIGGALAVQSFYIISGFYMALVLNEKYAPTARGTRTFYLSRLLRLYPVYLLILVISITGQFLFPRQFVDAWPYPASDEKTPAAEAAGDPLNTTDMWRQHAAQLSPGALAYLTVVNVLTIGQESTLFYTMDQHDGSLTFHPRGEDADPHAVALHRFLWVPQAWSMGVELLFYACAPFLVRRSMRTLVGLIAASLALRILLQSLGYVADPWSCRIFPQELAFFLMGAVGFHLYRRHSAWIERQRVVSIILQLLLFAQIVFFQFLPIPIQPRCVLLIVSVGIAVPFLFGLTRRNRVDRYLGEMSYPFYMAHILVIMGLAGSALRSPLLAIAVTFVVAMALYHAVDYPMDRVRQRLSQRKTIPGRAPVPVTVG